MKLKTNIKRPQVQAPHGVHTRAASKSILANQLKKLYGIPGDGAGATIGIIELGGGYVQSDVDAHFKSQGITTKPVKLVSIDGAENAPGDPNGADGEVMLDILVALGFAPAAQVVIYMAENTDASFLNAFKKAIADKVTVISCSWGAAEKEWTKSTMTSYDTVFASAAAAGIPITCAAGDNDSGDGDPGQNVDFPSSSPHVIGCGGTTLVATTPLQEAVWNDGTAGGATGGGVSADFTIPAFQAASNVPGGKFRGVPDVAGVADPETGYQVVVDGQSMVIGGTSAVAPLWAGIVACYVGLGGSAKDLLTKLYAAGSAGHDVTNGNNGTYTARPKYDCCTGLGTPDGKTLGAIFATTTVPPVPPAPPPPTPPTPPPPAPPPPIPSTHTLVFSLPATIDGKPVT